MENSNRHPGSANPFSRLNKYLVEISAFQELLIKGITPQISIPQYMTPAGRGGGKTPTGTNHNHMSYRRAMLKKRARLKQKAR